MAWPSRCRTPSSSSSRSVWRGDCPTRSEEHTSELQSPCNLVCRLLLEKKKHATYNPTVLPLYSSPRPATTSPLFFDALRYATHSLPSHCKSILISHTYIIT